MIQPILDELTRDAAAAIEMTKEELRQIRTGRPSPALVEDLPVNAYGGAMKLKELCTIATDSASTLLVVPFDQSVIQDIERALQGSNLGVSPRVEGHQIRIMFPELSEDQRQKFAKLAGQKAEDGKVQIRHQRENARRKIKNLFDAKDITEDERFKAFEDVDKMTKDLTDSLDEVKKKKEEEIMSL